MLVMLRDCDDSLNKSQRQKKVIANTFYGKWKTYSILLKKKKNI